MRQQYLDRSVTRDLVLASGSILNWNGETAITVGGRASLGGDVHATYTEQPVVRLRRDNFLEAAGGIGDTFDDVSSDQANLAASFEYSANAVTVVWRRTDIRFADSAVTANQAAVAETMQRAELSNPLRDSILVIEDAGQARQAFDALSGEVHASVDSALIAESLILQPLLFAPEPVEGIQLWGRGIIGSASLDGTDEVEKFSWKRHGLAAGLRYGAGDWWLGFGGGKISADSRHALHADADMDSAFIGGDAGYAAGRAQVRGGLVHAWHDVSTSRNVSYPGVSQSLSADYKAQTTQLFGNVDYALLETGDFRVAPFAGLGLIWAKRDGFAETGGTAALDLSSSSRALQVYDLGLRATGSLQASSTITVDPRLRIGWQGARGDTDSRIDAALAGASGMAVTGQSVARDRLAWDLGVGIDFGRTRLDVAWQAAAGSGSSDHAARIGLSIMLN